MKGKKTLLEYFDMCNEISIDLNIGTKDANQHEEGSCTDTNLENLEHNVKRACKNTNDFKINDSMIKDTKSNKIHASMNNEYAHEDGILESIFVNADNTSIKNKVNAEIMGRYRFLVDVRDKDGKKKGEQGYDGSTLLIPEDEYTKLSPFEKQFWSIKKDHFDTVVFFKKGKFYELYEDDALIGARLFDLKVTGRVNMRMSGFPEGSLDYWTKKFLENGYKIARVEQSENMIGKQIRERSEKEEKRASITKEKIIHRELKEVITQGTIYSADHMRSVMPMYLMSVAEDNTCYAKSCEGRVHLSVMLYDASVGDVYLSSFCDDEDRNMLKTILAQYDVREMISRYEIDGIPRIVPDCTVVVFERKHVFENEREYVCFMYMQNYMVKLKRPSALDDARIQRLGESSGRMVIDGNVLRSMEVFKNSYDGGVEKTLFNAVNFCVTAFGQRLLRRWILQPLMNEAEIMERQTMCRIMKKINVEDLRKCMKKIGDGERLVTRLYNGSPRVNDLNKFLICVDSSKEFLSMLLMNIENMVSYIDDLECIMIQRIKNSCIEYVNNIDEVLEMHKRKYEVSDTDIDVGKEEDEELCMLVKEKNAIENELNEYLERQRTLMRNKDIIFRDIGKDVFQIEVPKEVTVPVGYVIFSSTKNVNRYYTDDVRRLISRYNECEERIFQSRGMLLKRAIDVLIPHVFVLRQIFSYIAQIDCYVSFAMFSLAMKGSVPVVSEILSVSGMWNPVYEGHVKNDYRAEKKVLMLTGANMGGKSTFLRTVCMNVILGQVGMDVCCERMETPLFDRIFTRIGASDNLVKGESTFMVELSEAASVLKHSTNRSFVIMDELGRGTSTKDGECIAVAVIEFLKQRGCHVMFSTHYHRMARRMEGVMNGYMSSVVRDKDVIFLYKLVPGVSGDSHGLNVARMAGVPEDVVARAEEIRNAIERRWHDEREGGLRMNVRVGMATKGMSLEDSDASQS
ncbi:MutS-like mismatch repair ATPase [Ordospora colligata]|nr:MutS-like mismatch repair ATPase [Ordospora colligata]